MLTPNQAARIAGIAEWERGDGGMFYIPKGCIPAIYWDGVVTWDGFGDLLRVCEEQELNFCLGHEWNRNVVVQNNNTGDEFKRLWESHNDIPTALAVAVLKAKEGI